MSQYPELDEYINKAKSEGKTDNELMTEMKSAGYSEKDVEAVLSSTSLKGLVTMFVSFICVIAISAPTMMLLAQIGSVFRIIVIIVGVIFSFLLIVGKIIGKRTSWYSELLFFLHVAVFLLLLSSSVIALGFISIGLSLGAAFDIVYLAIVASPLFFYTIFITLTTRGKFAAISRWLLFIIITYFILIYTLGNLL